MSSTFGELMLPAWLQYLQACAVVLIPLIGIWIALQQVQIARMKLRFDLYEKRFAVFEAARKLVIEAITHGDISTSALSAYSLRIADAVFLFDDELSNYLRQLFHHANNLSVLKRAIEPSPVGSSQREDLVRRAGEETVWFNNQVNELVLQFKPFLKLDERERRRPSAIRSSARF